MKVYNEIFLPSEQNNALQDILISVHRHFRESKQINDNTLKEIYRPILEFQNLGDGMLWFNAWARQYCGDPGMYFIKDCDDDITARIIKIWSKKEYSQYVSSLSALAKNYGVKEGKGSQQILFFPVDYSYLITTKKSQECDVAMASEYIHDFFIHLNFEDVANLIGNRDFQEIRNKIEASYSKSEIKGNNEIIKALKDSYRQIENDATTGEAIEKLTDQLSFAWERSWGEKRDLNTLIQKKKLCDSNELILTIEKHRENIIRLINYYFWVKLAYPEDWNVLLYLPGVIAKKFESVPLGVNIGFKEMLPLEDILFLKRAVLTFFTRASIDYFENLAKEEAIKHGRQTAVAAIMGRNMSHNIGSHVLWHLSQKEQEGNESKKTTDPNKIFYDYIRERMGFIGLISTTSPSWVLEVDFLKITNDFKAQTILLQNIVKSEKENLKIELNFKNIEKHIGLPHGQYGAHAFYIILENIIRNTVKHNIEFIKNTSIEFTISIDETFEDKDYIKVKITDSLDQHSMKVDKLVKYLNKKIKEKIVDDTGKLINKDLGFKEKRISAAFLRLIPQKDIENRFKPPLLRIEQDNNHLVYMIYFMKPKKALVITEDTKNFKNERSFNDKGIYLVSKDTLKIEKFTHDFLVIDTAIDKDVERILDNNKLGLPFRILTKDDFNSDPLPSDPDKFYFLLWKKWFEKYFKDGRQNKKIHLILNRSEDWETSINNSCSNKIEVIRNKTQNDDHDPDDNIVLSHNVKLGKSKEVYKKAYYVEEIKSGGGDSGLYKMIEELESSPFLMYKLLETFLIKIVVVDERIYEKKDIFMKIAPSNDWKDHISLAELWGKRQVQILDHNKIIENNCWSDVCSVKPDILIIHQGVIDKYKDRWKEREFNKAWENIKRKIKYIIIDSDRGKPGDVKKLGARWLQFSDLSSIMIDNAQMNVAKYLLVNLVTSTREN